jgi:transcriptional regulator with XRE-family HTH domain
MYSKVQAAERLMKTQAALGLSNSDLATRAGVTPHAWSQYRTATRSISPQALAMLKEQFGVTADWILVGDASNLPHKLYAKILVSAA